jgi:hypothetical protein
MSWGRFSRYSRVWLSPECVCVRRERERERVSECGYTYTYVCAYAYAYACACACGVNAHYTTSYTNPTAHTTSHHTTYFFLPLIRLIASSSAATHVVGTN